MNTTKTVPSCPSVARLVSQLNLGEDQATALRARVREGFDEIPGHHWSHAVADFLEEINKLGEFMGVESLYPEKPHRYYLNAGDTYSPTLLYNAQTDSFRIGCLADLIGG